MSVLSHVIFIHLQKEISGSHDLPGIFSLSDKLLLCLCIFIESAPAARIQQQQKKIVAASAIGKFTRDRI